MSVKIDFTVSGGIDEKLYSLIKDFCDKFDTVLLCKEGGDGDTHAHAHAVIEVSIRTDNFKRTIKKLYTENGYGWTRCTVMVKKCVDVAGALRYVYKEKRVMLCKGYIVKNIKPWADKPKKDKVKRKGREGVVYLTMGNAVDKIIDYAEDQGIKVDDYLTFKQVLKDMALAKYRVCMILRNIRPIMIDVLAHFGDSVHLDAFLDLNCNMFA